MTFPEWAPLNLVQLYTGETGDSLTGEEARQALYRLLTQDHMKHAWEHIGRRFNVEEIVLLTIHALSIYVNGLGAKPPPVAAKVSYMNRVANLALKLARAIETSDIDSNATAFRWWSDDEVSKAWQRIGKQPDIPSCILLQGRENEDICFTPQGHLENHFAEESPSLVDVLRRLSDQAKSDAERLNAEKNQRSKIKDLSVFLAGALEEKLGNQSYGIIAHFAVAIYDDEGINRGGIRSILKGGVC